MVEKYILAAGFEKNETYFKKKISLETLIEKTGIYESEFSNCLLQEMIIAFDSKDAERIGYLIYTLCLWDELVGKNKFHEFEKFATLYIPFLFFAPILLFIENMVIITFQIFIPIIVVAENI